MIDFYYYTSPNARKVLIMLEETGLPYRVIWVDITAGEQFDLATPVWRQARRDAARQRIEQR